MIGGDGKVTNACGHVGIYPAAGKEWRSPPSQMLSSSGAGDRAG